MAADFAQQVGSSTGGRRSRSSSLPFSPIAIVSFFGTSNCQRRRPSEVTIPTKLLVCDDESVLRALIRAALEPRGYAIVEAQDGDDSVEQARRERPDLIVLDMMMPGRSGLDVLAELRRDPELAATPVLMLSARTQAGDREAAASAGADRFLAKPFSPLELGSIVDALLESRR